MIWCPIAYDDDLLIYEWIYCTMVGPARVGIIIFLKINFYNLLNVVGAHKQQISENVDILHKCCNENWKLKTKTYLLSSWTWIPIKIFVNMVGARHSTKLRKCYCFLTQKQKLMFKTRCIIFISLA